MADAVLVHLPDRRDLDAAAALRSMYELAVTLTWVLLDPEPHNDAWREDASSRI
jgi:myo-inositol catabolism protein IolC